MERNRPMSREEQRRQIEEQLRARARAELRAQQAGRPATPRQRPPMGSRPGAMPGSFAPGQQPVQRGPRGPMPPVDPRARRAPADPRAATVRPPEVPKREAAEDIERRPRVRRVAAMGIGGVVVAAAVVGFLNHNEVIDTGGITAAMGQGGAESGDTELVAEVPIMTVGPTALDAEVCRSAPKTGDDGEELGGSAIASLQVTGAMPLVPVWTNAETEKGETVEPYLTDAKLSGDLGEYKTESGYQEFLLESYPLQFFACQVKGAAPAIVESPDGGYEINRSSISVVAAPAMESRAVLKPGDSDPYEDITLEGREDTVSLDPASGIYASMPRSFMYPVSPYVPQSQAEYNALLINKDQSDAALQTALNAVVAQLFGGQDETEYPDKNVKNMTDLIDRGILQRLEGTNVRRDDVRFAGSYNRAVDDLTRDTDPELKMVGLPGDPYERVRVDEAKAYFGGIKATEYTQPEPSEEPKDKEE